MDSACTVLINKISLSPQGAANYIEIQLGSFGKDILIVVLLSLGTVLYLVFRSYKQSAKGALPPGPRGIPFLGNALQLSPLPWLKLTEWKDQYGPLYSLNLAGQPVIVVNTHKMAADLLDRRSAIYSDRGRLIMGSEILCGEMFIAFTGFNALWKRLRKAAHEGFTMRAIEPYLPIQEREAATLAQSLLQDPQNWPDHLKRSTASTVLSAVYAMPPIASAHDPLVERINNLIASLAEAGRPGAYLVDIFPFLNYLPTWAAKWKREGMARHEEYTSLYAGLFDGVRQRMESGDCRPCFAASIMDHKELSQKEAAWLAGTMFGAGAETTAAALDVFILAMVIYPEVMRKAQAEIDTVVGRSKLPTFADRDGLPYVRAMVKEVLRWRSIGPIGLPHRSIKDDIYEGYFIPKGALIFTNVWAMCRDPDVFPDFDTFRPERFLDGAEQVDWTPPDTHGQGHCTYGFGRRLCVGKDLANNSIFIDIATILWAFSIEKARDAEGNEITPDVNQCIDEGLVVRPAHFLCLFTPRSGDVAEMLNQACFARQTI